MKKLTETLETFQSQQAPSVHQPFSVYSSTYTQQLFNVPIANPLLILVLQGEKHLGRDNPALITAGSFIFLSDKPSIDMRNIPKDNAYLALLIEFCLEDFEQLPLTEQKTPNFLTGELSSSLENCFIQFIESCQWAPEAVLKHRKQELLLMINALGHNVSALRPSSKLSSLLHNLFYHQAQDDLNLTNICQRFAMSESTLRRRLSQEGTSLSQIKDNARLGLGLHLLQISHDPISLIAEECGYQSQSRFTERFKLKFGLTPSELRKTKLKD